MKNINVQSIFAIDDVNDHLINWKAAALLKFHQTRFGDIKPRKYTKVTLKKQKAIRVQIIRARELLLLPYIRQEVNQRIYTLHTTMASKLNRVRKYQRRKRKKTHGFRARMATSA